MLLFAYVCIHESHAQIAYSEFLSQEKPFAIANCGENGKFSIKMFVCPRVTCRGYFSTIVEGNAFAARTRILAPLLLLTIAY